jgi:hypothetical protein
MSESGGFTIPSWICDIDASSICLLYHSAKGVSEMLDSVARGKELNAGFMYITDDVLYNPWDKLPTFYKEEVAALAVTSDSITCDGRQRFLQTN